MDWRDAEREYDPGVTRESLAATFDAAARRHADRVAQRYKGDVYDRSLVAGGVLDAAPDGDYADVTYGRMRGVVRRLSAGFRELGVAPGDRVGLFSNTRMEWAHADFAVLGAGAVTTTVYTSSSERQVRHLLGDPGATGVVVENRDLLDRVFAVEDDLDLEFVVLVDGDPHDRDDVYTLAELYDLGASAGADPDADADDWVVDRDRTDLASLIYTSGTTGTPKGAELTHGNFLANVDQCLRRFGDRPDKAARETPVIDESTTALSFLPLAHVFERLAGHFMLFAAGATVAYAESPNTLREDFGLVRPTTATSVPRVYEKLYDAIREQAGGSRLTKRVFEWATDVGREHYRADDPSPSLRARYALADRLVFSSVKEALGGEIAFFISGGGSLSADLCELYQAMGVPILEGYGLTETSPVLAVNPPEEPKVGTIGPPVVGVDVRVDSTVAGDPDDAAGEVGELLVKGPNVFRGYRNLPAETDAAFDDDGWFRTGDVVELRPDGYVAFRERAKQLLKLSTGKYVPPGAIEDAFADSEYVEQAIVLGDARKFVSALVVPKFPAVEAWADREGYDLPDDRRARCRDDRVRELVQREIDRVNAGFEEHERIKQFRVVPEEFTEENGLLTPTMKKKRRNILDRYADEVEMFYEP
ncbi:AMP-dependent synthetase/ligase [Candidatus Halobonum tyrrellensis]|uniref:Amp-forming long-chain acyl-CoA synthetase n=1 Tax=Candidatus Halobonum tyrrellensis G22 TaxID=1324957 RepID=V4IWJ3_9EURY|nr:long-chain fatty acid--CoA ligase [Candidatus Halobonum tyrrellensis]ESP87557.1 amp-forming long-chain acyl-CoA synthetase [Candidatus Halobonum tyrrellensis G22]